MLLTTVFLWALNLSITKYILEEGVAPLSYAVVRYALAGAIFVALTLLVERTLRIERRHRPCSRSQRSCCASTSSASSLRST